MNKYKIVSLVLALALLAALVRLVYSTEVQPAPASASDVVLQNIFSRKSVRSYTDRPVSRAQLDTLVRAAMAAPSGRDMRPWKFVVVDDRAVMDTLAARLPKAKMLADAPAAVVVCGDQSIVDSEGKPSVNWAYDCSAAAENLLLTAEAMGLGAVWTGVSPYADRMQAVSEALNLPDHITPFCVIPVGYPEGQPRPKDKYKAENVRYNGW